MNTPHPAWTSIRQSLQGPVGWLVLLNVIVFGVLIARIIASLLFGASPSALLLTGMHNQISRLEIIAEGSCDSIGMQQFRRGEIGPIPSPLQNEMPPPQAIAPFPSTPIGPSLPGTEQSGSTTPLLPAEVPDTSAAPLGSPGRMLNPDSLRRLVQQSVVRVLTDKATGTGFAIGPNIVVTNRHVIEDARSDSILVTSKFLGAEPAPAKLLFSSENSQFGDADFAVLEVQGAKQLVPLAVGTDPKPLDNVVAAGYPDISVRSDSDEVSPDVVFSQGEVSVVQPQANGVDFVIHTATIAPGSSGGPLINRCGTIVGVNTFVGFGGQSEGRALYALSPNALAKYLSSTDVAFGTASSECASGGG